ncbi:extensin family protein [Microvirga massiliensis]|uniref:extensin-like domain-containing protein n=1 Tax=Microvirga massiliensis TaxID=1033741 RepID=UPI0006602900|nr:extensin family protein [Microvirga massiliensis]
MFLRLIAAITFILSASAGMAQREPPVPPRRPTEAPSPMTPPGPRRETPPPAVKVDTPQAAPPETDTCLTSLRAAGFDIESAEQPQVSKDECRIEMPVRLKAVPVPSKPGSAVRLTEQPVLACRFADRLGHWIGDLVAPVIIGIKGSDLKAIRTGPGFECRNRNRSQTGKLSAHAEGIAIDIAGFELTNGLTLRLGQEPDSKPDPALAALRTAACGWFTTILGPGSDEAHRDHLHVDILQHGSTDRYRICQ